MPNRNVLVWAQAGGMGDTVLALAYGMLEFEESPFDLVIGTIYNPADAGDVFRGYHEDVSRAFTLCRSLTCKTVYPDARAEPVQPDYSLLGFARERYGRHADIRFVPFYHQDYTRYGMDNIAAIKKRFRRFFRPEIDNDVVDYLKSDKLNICFHMRHLKVPDDVAADAQVRTFTNRNIDTEKWAAFIDVIAEDPQLNLIGIGESNPASPHYISAEDVRALLGRSNIHLPCTETGTSLVDDLFFATACDAMIVNNSGPSLFPIVFDNPLIYLDFEYDADHIEVSHDWTRLLSPHQWRPYGRKRVEEMTELFADFRRKELSDIRLPREPSVWAKKFEPLIRHESPGSDTDPAAAHVAPVNSPVPRTADTSRPTSSDRTRVDAAETHDLLMRNRELKDRHAGRRCFVIGNGPSLRNADLARLRGEVTFVMNDFWRHPDARAALRPTWYLNGHMTHRDMNLYIERFEAMKQFDRKTEFIFMLPTDSHEFDVRELAEYCGSPVGSDPYYCRARCGTSSSEAISCDLSSALIRAKRTSSYAIEAAVYMGCSEICLLGFDHVCLHAGHQAGGHFFEEKFHSVPETDQTLAQNATQEMEFFERLLLTLGDRGVKIRNLTPGSEPDPLNECAAD